MLILLRGVPSKIITDSIRQPLGFPATIGSRSGVTVTATLELAACVHGLGLILTLILRRCPL